MAAVIQLRSYIGANAANESNEARTTTSFLTADLHTNTIENRNLYKIPAGENSYTRWLRLKIATAPANAVTNFKWWITSPAVTNVALRAKEAQGTGGASPGTGGVTPTRTAMTGDIDAYTRTAAAPGTWDSASYSTVGHVTKALVLQLQPNASVAASLNFEVSISFSYDET